jgi:single-stranded DNA-binding protein
MDIMRYDGRDKQEKAHEITINLWGDAYAEKVAEITPGKQVLVIGRPQIDQFTDRGGNTQRSFVVEASSFHFLSELAANSEMPTSQPSAAMPSAQPAANPSADNMMDEEIPF